MFDSDVGTTLAANRAHFLRFKLREFDMIGIFHFYGFRHLAELLQLIHTMSHR